MLTLVMQYETNSDDVRRLFEEHGEIRTFFDLIANRGMVFVTYVSTVSLRGASMLNKLSVRSASCGKSKRAATRIRNKWQAGQSSVECESAPLTLS